MTAPNPNASFLDKAAQPFAGLTPAGEKSWIVAVALAFFLGAIGAHNFYLGYTKKGGLQLGVMVIGLVTAIIVIGGLVVAAVALWGFVEFIMIIIGAGGYDKDAAGMPLKR